MANWIPFTSGRILAEPMEKSAKYMLAVVDMIADLLTLTGNVLKIFATIVQGFVDPIATAIQTLIDTIKNFLNDLMNFGFYLWTYAPTTRQTAVRFNQWCAKAADSFDKTDDRKYHQPPQFSRDAYVGALVFCVAFPTFEELVLWFKNFIELFSDGWDYKTPNFHKDISKDVGGKSSIPDPAWRSAALKDIKPMKNTLNAWIQTLDKFTKINDITAVIRNFAEFITNKGDELRAFAEYTRNTIENLIKATEQTGVYVLPIYGRGGNELIQSALRNQSGDPTRVESTDEAGARKATEQIRSSAGKIVSLDPATSFTAPSNLDNTPVNAIMGAVDTMNQSLSDRLDRINNDASMNPSGRLTTVIDKTLMSDEQKKEYESRKKAGYPDEAGYFNPVSGLDASTVNGGSSGVLSSVKVQSTREEANNELNSLAEGAKSTVESFINVTEETSFGCDFSQNFTLLNTDKGDAYFKVVSIYPYGMYNSSEDNNKLIQKSLEYVKENLTSGGAIVVDLLDIYYPTNDVSYPTSIVDLFTNYFYTNLNQTASEIIFITGNKTISDGVTGLQTNMESLAKQYNLGSPSLNTDSGEQVVPEKKLYGAANDVGTRSAGEAAGVAISDSMGDYGDITKDVPYITYDENGHEVIKYKKEKIGSRFAPTSWPDFAGNNNWTLGCMVVTGGPSESSAQALFNLLGITIASTELVALGVEEEASQVAQTMSMFNDFGENIKYSAATKTASGKTLAYP